MPRVVAIASGGGHWIQLRRLRPLLDELDVFYVSVDASYGDEVGADRLYVVRDASRWTKLGLIVQAFQVLWILARLRPDVVLSTGRRAGLLRSRVRKALGRAHGLDRQPGQRRAGVALGTAGAPLCGSVAHAVAAPRAARGPAVRGRGAVIFVAVGTQGHFDRMLRPIDEWAGRTGRKDVFAQIGSNAWRPPHTEWVERLDASEFRARVERADLVISHAGMGTILTALELGKPVLIMPRRAALGEQRNDHQVATARKLEALGLANVANDEHELAERLQNLDQLRIARRDRAVELDSLLATLRRFLVTGV